MKISKLFLVSILFLFIYGCESQIKNKNFITTLQRDDAIVCVEYENDFLIINSDLLKLYFVQKNKIYTYLNYDKKIINDNLLLSSKKNKEIEQYFFEKQFLDTSRFKINQVLKLFKNNVLSLSLKQNKFNSLIVYLYNRGYYIIQDDYSGAFILHDEGRKLSNQSSIYKAY